MVALAALSIAACAAQAALPIQHWTTASGARVYFVESRGIPMLDVNVDFDAGGRRAPADKAGLGGLTHTLIKAGSAARSEEEISRRIADVGAQLGGSVDRDRAGLSVRTLSSERERTQAIATFAEILQTPAFPDAAFAREKARLVDAVREDETKPDAIVSKAFYRLLYAAHPYALAPTPETVLRIERADVESFYRANYVAGRAVVTIIGDADRALAERIAEQLTAGLPRARGAPVPLPAVTQPPSQTLRIAHPASQSHILLGLPAIARNDADYFPLLVGNYILGGGGFVSRLYLEVREKRGYAYSVYSYFLPLAQEGPFEIGLQTKKEQAEEALARVRIVLDEFLDRGPSAAEMKAAKQNLVGGFALRIDSNRKLLDQVALIGYYQLPLSWLDDFTARVEKVSVAEVRAVFARRVRPGNLVTVVAGSGEK
ncbi:MAG: zinc protease [Betaproteobacteria bacterium RIFCSPLOWO2_12_FULL_64_23]|nr:MAG: zinc protease [Betaproteobacteria bacterium RIFCSPLOWO2_12_FULL_64_23]